MIIIPFKASHYEQMVLQDHQKYLSSWVTVDMMLSLENEGLSRAFSAFDDNHNVLAMAGVLKQWNNRGIAWAYFSDKVDCRNFIKIHRAVARFLKTCEFKRVEMTVDCEFEQGHRWAKQLGFTLESERMVAYRPDGGDCALYSRVV